MSQSNSAHGIQAVARAMRPKSVAIIGMSARPNSAGQNVFNGLKTNEFKGDIHLVGRSDEPINGLPVLKSAADLPQGVDLAVFCLPAAGVKEAVVDCVKAKVGSAVIFAAGFAEVGDRSVQQDVEKIARDGGLAIIGPNCLGFTNNVDRMQLYMLFARKCEPVQPDKAHVAIVGQSGGMLGHIQRAVEARGMPISFSVTLGNEAGLDLADFVEYLAGDKATKVIVLYGEQIRRPKEFVEACDKARAAKKPVILLHPGRTAKARVAAASHTGSLVGDHGSTLINVARAGVLTVGSLDELTDIAELVMRFPEPSGKGPTMLTASGAYVALVNDMSDELALDWPPLSDKTMQTVTKALPAFANPGNPLDTTAGTAPGTLPIVTKALMEDENTGILMVSYPINIAKTMNEIIQGMQGTSKPALVVALGDGFKLPDDLMDAAKTGPFVFSRSSDRALRTVANYVRYGKLLERLRNKRAEKPQPFSGLPELAKGAQPEWIGKKAFAAMGIRVPEGGLAKSADEAASIAKRVGFPVAMKAQAAALTHKTEAGGVLLNIADEAGAKRAWDTLAQNVQRAQPGVKLDGVLVEKMAAKGLELMVGAKRDAAWGPVLLVGLGGIWVEALGDVRLLAPDASEDEIVEEMMKLRTSKLLKGFRGAPEVDVQAVAKTVQLIGRLMLTRPEVVEVDVNPLVALPKGQGALALDALIVTG